MISLIMELRIATYNSNSDRIYLKVGKISGTDIIPRKEMEKSISSNKEIFNVSLSNLACYLIQNPPFPFLFHAIYKIVETFHSLPGNLSDRKICLSSFSVPIQCCSHH